MPRKLAPIPSDKFERIRENYGRLYTLLGKDLMEDLKGHIRAADLAKLSRLLGKLEAAFEPILATAGVVPATAEDVEEQ